MKVVILCGGRGTRLSEETDVRPKPMVEIGGHPILWHIMKCYSYYGFHDFVILLGYKGYYIKEYFANYFLHQSDVTIDLATNRMDVHNNASEPWKVTLLDTGVESMTGGRILRCRPYIGDEAFMLTYGDGLSDIDISSLLRFHRSHSGMVTMTSVQPEGRYGLVDSNRNGRVREFNEKLDGDGSWCSGGFFVCDPGVFGFLNDGDATIFEGEPLESLAGEKHLYTYRHEGFWKCMDTVRDKIQLNEMWDKGEAKWKVWESIATTRRIVSSESKQMKAGYEFAS